MRSLPRPMPLFLEADTALSRRNPSVSSGVTWTPTSFMFGRWRATGGIDSPFGSCTRGLRLLQKMQQLEDAQVSNASSPSHSSSGPVVTTETIRGQILDCCCRWNLELHGWHGQHGKESIEDLPNQVWACRVPQLVQLDLCWSRTGQR
ncbi:uncharacterized protein [Triticum aestivum]|uniref:uncharacterized protein n=1 Tax=Triticum aestivum TaxID=4565 RepID=UPI000842FF80|nr:uncharacterized protein LOC123132668 [Triticum aestivum]